jgi:hypothetical protein
MIGESLSGIRRPSGRLFFCPESGRGRDRSGRAGPGGPPPEGEGGGGGGGVVGDQARARPPA